MREWRDWGRFSGFEGNREKRVRQNQLESGQKRREVDDDARLCLALKIYIQNDVKLIEDKEPR